MAYLLRLELPDVPGALGSVATALGRAGADILAMDVVERTGNRAVDDLIVDLPGGPPDLLIAAAESITDVRVESVLPDPGVAGAHREWELVEALTADPPAALKTLAALLPEVLRVGWAVVLEVDEDGRAAPVATGGGAPVMDGMVTTLSGLGRPTRLDGTEQWVPEDWRRLATELAAAPVAGSIVVVVGRPGGPAMRDVEVARLGHLASLAAAVGAREAAGYVRDTAPSARDTERSSRDTEHSTVEGARHTAHSIRPSAPDG